MNKLIKGMYCFAPLFCIKKRGELLCKNVLTEEILLLLLWFSIISHSNSLHSRHHLQHTETHQQLAEKVCLSALSCVCLCMWMHIQASQRGVKFWYRFADTLEPDMFYGFKLNIIMFYMTRLINKLVLGQPE